MSSFVWDNNFITGLSTVDLQHKKLVDIINRFGSLLAENQMVFEDVESLFHELVDYTEYHFTEEESMMIEVGVDKRHIVNQIESHRMFINEITSLYSAVTPENMDIAKYLFEFLTHWLTFHILGIDQDMARQIKAIKSGVEPSLAYKREERERDSSTELLLKALNEMFTQISERNKDLITLNQSLENKVAKRTKELSEANSDLEILSSTDALTGLPNRRFAMNCLSLLWDESISADLPLVCMMIDADHFKAVNDSHGHHVGDQVLTELARTLKYSLRNDDVVCRLGGDEFLVICPNTDEKNGVHVAELIREKVSELKVPTGDTLWQASISAGVACRTSELKTYEDLIKVADRGVYLAKRDGKNCVRTCATGH